MAIRVEGGDMREVLPRLAGEGVRVQAVVTDPPYHLTSIVRRFGAEDAAPARAGQAAHHTGAYARASRGFMGKQWDGGDIAFRPETWRLCWDLLPPGGHLLAFSGTRTYHRMAVAIEDAGFELRDMIAWLYGSGFPKSHNLDGAWEGWGTALKPALEPVCFARKPLAGTVAANMAAQRVGALHVDACRVPTDETITATRNVALGAASGGIYGAARVAGRYEQKDGGRWPANVVHDGSDEVVEAFPFSAGQLRDVTGKEQSHVTKHAYGQFEKGGSGHVARGDSGSAARFFYSSKADSADRLGSKHPTVKPVDLMRWLVRLVTPPGGTVLDPFAGSGTTGMACLAEGRDAILVEREPEYLTDIRRRIAHVEGADTPLFGGATA